MKYSVKKQLFLLFLLGVMSFVTLPTSDAATREEIANIKVKTKADFKYWNSNSPTMKKIVNFVENATNPNSADYIPPEDRIANFDMDGTFYCETAPIYFQEAMFLYRVLEDKSYNPPADLLNLAKMIKPKVYNKEKLTHEESGLYFKGLSKAYAGMTPEEYRAYCRKFMDTNEAGLSNLKRGEAFYLPMVEIISYLTNNDFKVYINTACGILTTRELVGDIIDVRPDRIIGSDFNLTSTNMGNDIAKGHFYDRRKEKIIISGEPIIENAKTVKIFSIYNYIGKKPVLTFGNSMGDSGMLEFTLQDNKYKSLSFYVLCDDVERERGNLERAKNDKAFAEGRGWNTISMRDEFKTIYGDNVKRVK